MECALIWPSCPTEPTSAAMSQANARTTMVRTAVATSESVCLMPHLARIDVMPAKSAEPTAASIHMGNLPSS